MQNEVSEKHTSKVKRKLSNLNNKIGSISKNNRGKRQIFGTIYEEDDTDIPSMPFIRKKSKSKKTCKVS